jgi:hypothetical protein
METENINGKLVTFYLVFYRYRIYIYIYVDTHFLDPYVCHAESRVWITSPKYTNMQIYSVK